MTDQELIEQSAALQPIYCDGFGGYRKVNGVLRCVGFVLQGGANLNLIISLTGADWAQLETQRVLSERDTPPTFWAGTELAH